MNMMPLIISWALLATVVLALALYRRTVAAKEDDFLHVDSNAVVNQQAIAKKLETIDRWGKRLTVIAVVYALVLLGIFLYNGWNESSTKVSL